MRTSVFLFITLLGVFGSAWAIKDACNDCKVLVGMVKRVFSNELGPKQMKAVEDLGCNCLPDFLKNSCPTVIDTVYKTIKETLIVQKVPTDDICKMFGACN